MNPTVVSSDLKQLRQAVSTQRYAIIGLVGAVVLCLLLMQGMVGRERTIIVPPVIEKSFWVTHDKVSGSYLEQMAAFVTYLILDVSPDSIEWKRGLLLRYALPSSTAELENRQKEEGERLKTLNATTQFAVTGIKPNESDMSVLIAGKLATFVNGQRTSEQNKYYRAQFIYTANRIHLSKFEEMGDDTKAK